MELYNSLACPNIVILLRTLRLINASTAWLSNKIARKSQNLVCFVAKNAPRNDESLSTTLKRTFHSRKIHLFRYGCTHTSLKLFHCIKKFIVCFGIFHLIGKEFNSAFFHRMQYFTQYPDSLLYFFR